MPRNARVDVAGEIYHVINRANGCLQIFNTDADYRLFEQLLADARELIDMRILAYVIMPNHWHLVLHPKQDGDLGSFMHRVCNAHTRKVHAKTGTNGSGHLYQGRYKSFLVDSDEYLLSVIKYIERNPVRAQLSKRCEEWVWGSVPQRINSIREETFIDTVPALLPNNYLEWINSPDKEDDLSRIRTSVQKGVPFGRDRWIDQMVKKFNLESTLRAPGRPKVITT